MTIPNDHAASTTNLERCIRKFAEDVRELLLHHPETAELATKLEARLTPALNAQRSHEPIVCVILGQLNTGKSTLLNKIVDKENCAPIGYNETTENISRFQFGIDERCNEFRIYWRDRDPEDRDLKDVKDWTETDDGKNSPQTALLDFFVNSQFLEDNNIVLIDTPGTGSTKTRHDEEIQQFLQGEHEATTQYGIIPHVLIYVVSDANPETISKLDEYAQALGILPECSIVVVSSDESGEYARICELLREELRGKVSIVLPSDQIEILRDKLSSIPNPDLVKVLTIYRIVSNVHEEAVEILEEIVREEEAHKQRGKELRDSLESAIGGAIPKTSLDKSMETLQTAVSHLNTFNNLPESLQSDLQKREELLTNFYEVLRETREDIGKFPGAAAAFSKQQEKLEESWNQEKQRIEDSRKVWEEVLSGLPQIVGDLEVVETYIKEAARPSVYDVYKTAQEYLNDLTPGIEKRIIHVNQLLKDLRDIKGGIQQKVDLFEKDIIYLVLLEASASGLTEDDRKDLLCLLGQNGTTLSSRLKFKPDDQAAKEYILERISHWNINLLNALDQDLVEIFYHALARLENMLVE